MAFDAYLPLVPALLSALGRSGPDYADVFFHDLQSITVDGRIGVRSGRTTQTAWLTAHTRIRGAACRAIQRNNIGFETTDDLSDSALENAAREAAACATNLAAVDETPRSRALEPTAGDHHEIVRAVLDATMAFAADIDSARVTLSEIEASRLVATSTGILLSDTRTRVEVVVVLRKSDREIRKTTCYPDLSHIDLLGASPKASHVALMAAPSVGFGRSRQIPVVLKSGWGGTWLHEAVGHQLEADTLVDGLSGLAISPGSVIGPAFLDIVDDPTIQNGRASMLFDDEGTDCVPTTLVEAGCVVGCLTDRRHNLIHGFRLRGNGRRAHYASHPRPRMTNLLLGTGTTDVAALISDPTEGILVDDIGHANYDPESGIVTLQATRARRLRRGKIIEQLDPLTVSATPLQFLAGIVAVGDDFRLDGDRGYCSKDGLVVPISVGQPTVLIHGLAVAGM